MVPARGERTDHDERHDLMKGPAARTLLVLAIAAGFAAIFVRLAWVSDDAYITLRSVENLATGNGLRWNAVDRVQTYTHPLWMLVLAAGRAIKCDLYLTAIRLGIGLSSSEEHTSELQSPRHLVSR